MPGPLGDQESRQPGEPVLPDGAEASSGSSSSNDGTAAVTIPGSSTSASAPNDPASASPAALPPDATPSRAQASTTSSVASTLSSGPAASQNPSSQQPAIPPRNYPRDVRLLQYTPSQSRQRLRPSQTLPRFIRFLAAFIFVAGSGATLAAFLYRRYLYPRLLLARTRLTELQQANLSNYDKLLSSLRLLVTENALVYKRTAARLEAGRALADPTLPAAAQADIANGVLIPATDVASEETKSEARISEEKELAMETQPLLVEGEGEQAGEGAALGEVEAGPAPVMDLTRDLREALGKLQVSLLHDVRPSRSATVEEEKKSYLPEPTAAQNLQRTLDSFSTYLTNESFYASTPSYPSSAYGYNYGSMGSAIPTRSGMDKDKIAQLKTDIRGLKGALLTRKNFAPVTGR